MAKNVYTFPYIDDVTVHSIGGAMSPGCIWDAIRGFDECL